MWMKQLYFFNDCLKRLTFKKKKCFGEKKVKQE